MWCICTAVSARTKFTTLVAVSRQSKMTSTRDYQMHGLLQWPIGHMEVRPGIKYNAVFTNTRLMYIYIYMCVCVCVCVFV